MADDTVTHITAMEINPTPIENTINVPPNVTNDPTNAITNPIPEKISISELFYPVQ